MEYKIFLTLLLVWTGVKRGSDTFCLAALLVNKTNPDRKLTGVSDKLGRLQVVIELVLYLSVFYIIWSF